MTHTDRPERPKGPPPPAPDELGPDRMDGGRMDGSRMDGGRPATRRIAPAVARQIDENLKLLYQSRVEEDLPPQLKDLVARLRGSEGGA